MKTYALNDRVLVAYDSRLGSTAEVAAYIGSVLSEKGASARSVQRAGRRLRRSA